MPALFIRHKVTEYATWKSHFDELAAPRRAHGCQGSRLFRNADDPNETLIFLAWDDLDRARLFAQSDDLRDAFRQPTVLDEPDIWLIEEYQS